MIWFVLFFIAAFAFSLKVMVRKYKKRKEIVLFSFLSLLGFTEWMSIILYHPFKPTKWIAAVIEWTGL